MGKQSIYNLEFSVTEIENAPSQPNPTWGYPQRGFPDFVRVFGCKWRINYYGVMYYNVF